MFPGMAEAMENMYKVKMKYFEDGHTHWRLVKRSVCLYVFTKYDFGNKN